MTVAVLIVDRTVSLHPDYLAALAALRSNYAQGDDHIPDMQLIEFVRSQECQVDIEQHDLDWLH